MLANVGPYAIPFAGIATRAIVINGTNVVVRAASTRVGATHRNPRRTLKSVHDPRNHIMDRRGNTHRMLSLRSLSMAPAALPTACPSSRRRRAAVQVVNKEDPRGVLGVVHSIESMSAIDGPGLRYLIFLQGCQRRCTFCSNPDTWKIVAPHEPEEIPLAVDGSRLGSVIFTSELEKRISRCANYLKTNQGGISCSGGEPLLQARFVENLFTRVKQNLGLTTCLDTSGMGDPHTFDSVLAKTDLTLLCPKSFDPDLHYDISKLHINHLYDFVKAVDNQKASLMVRYVYIPDSPYRTDSDRELDALADFVNARPHCRGVELLPYHRLGVHKWDAIGVKYPLKALKIPTAAQVESIKAKISSRLDESKHVLLA